MEVTNFPAHLFRGRRDGPHPFFGEEHLCIICEVGNSHILIDDEPLDKEPIGNRLTAGTRLPLREVVEKVCYHPVTVDMMICTECVKYINREEVKKSELTTTRKRGRPRKNPLPAVVERPPSDDSSEDELIDIKKIKLEDDAFAQEHIEVKTAGGGADLCPVVLHVSSPEKSLLVPSNNITLHASNDQQHYITEQSEIIVSGESTSNFGTSISSDCFQKQITFPPTDNTGEIAFDTGNSLGEAVSVNFNLEGIQSSSKAENVECCICSNQYSTSLELDDHLINEHNVAANYICNQCCTGFTLESSFLEHSKQGCYSCLHCHRVFKTSIALGKHQHKVHQMKLKCQYCSYQTTCSKSLMRHDATVHQKHVQLLQSCSLCNVKCNSIPQLEDHCIQSHQFIKKYKCKLCGQKFATEIMEKHHEKLEHSIYKCYKCKVGFKKNEKLLKHIESVHKYETEQINPAGPNLIPKTESGSTSESNSGIPTQAPKVFHMEDNEIDNYVKEFRGRHNSDKVPCCMCSGKVTVGHLRTHLRRHCGIAPFKCSHCEFKAFQSTNLRKHIRNNHPEQILDTGSSRKQVLPCEYCNIMCETSESLELHLWEHLKEKKYECAYCNTKFGMETNLKEHIKTHYFPKRVACPYCSREFSSIGFYKEHIEKCKNNWYCNMCCKEFKSENAYRKHQNLVHNVENKHLYRCDIAGCNKSYIEKHRYDDHMITHDPEKRYSCPHCRKTFKRARPLKTHINSVHPEHKTDDSTTNTSIQATPFEQKVLNHPDDVVCCETCSAYFVNKETLENHQRVTHPDDDNFELVSCSKCDEMFSSEIGLKKHSFTHGHTFYCTAYKCNELFFDSISCQNHMRTQHSEIDYTCKFCNAVFYTELALIEHCTSSSSHIMEFKCRLCSEIFFSKKSLELHKKAHTTAQHYSCSSCITIANSKQMLFDHMKIKHGAVQEVKQKCHTCSYCQRKFLTKKINSHLIKHRNEGHVADGNQTEWRVIDFNESVNGKKKSCHNCGEVWDSKGNEEDHLNSSPECAVALSGGLEMLSGVIDQQCLQQDAVIQEVDGMQYVFIQSLPDSSNKADMELQELQNENFVLQVGPNNELIVCGMEGLETGQIEGSIPLSNIEIPSYFGSS